MTKQGSYSSLPLPEYRMKSPGWALNALQTGTYA